MPSILLSSTVIGIIITGAYSFFQFQKANSLKYITEERKKWREEIRDIMKEIESCEEQNISKVLAQLKARINAYGMCPSVNYEKDSHIWKLIIKIERNKEMNIQAEKSGSMSEQLEKQRQEYSENKEQLILFLSLLLKKDWDRSKNEVGGYKYRIINSVWYSAVILLFVLCLYKDLYKSIYLELDTNNILFIFYSIVIGLISIKGLTSFRWYLHEEHKQSATRIERHKKNSLKKLICVVFPYTIIFLLAGLFLLNENDNEIYFLFIIVSFLMIVSSFVNYNDEITVLSKEQDYAFIISQLLSNKASEE